jgi:hypothetical protein
MGSVLGFPKHPSNGEGINRLGKMLSNYTKKKLGACLYRTIM